MLQSNVFSAYNYEWLSQQTLEKTTRFCGPSMQGFNLRKQTLNSACLLANWEYYPLPSPQNYPRKNKEPTLRFSEFSSVCIYLQNETNWGNLLKVKSPKWHSLKTHWAMVWEA